MANIEKKKREELSFNAGIIVTSIDRDLDGGYSTFTTYNMDASIEEIAEAMKFVIDSGWFGSYRLYARKIKTFFDKREVDAVLLVRYENEFDYLENNGYITVPIEYPLVIGTRKVTKNENAGLTYDGNVYIKPALSEYLSLEDWKNMNNKDSMKMSLQ